MHYKRIAILLAAILVFLIIFTSFSENLVQEMSPGFPAVGETFVFGRYEQDNDLSNGPEPVSWRVLRAEGGQALIISEHCLDARPYNTKSEAVTWETSTLRAWLNGEFLETAFTPEEQKAVLTVSVNNRNDLSRETDGGRDTNDRVFLLSVGEADGLFSGDDDRRAPVTSFALARGAYDDDSCGFWWLRTIGESSPSYAQAAAVEGDGNITDLGVDVESNGFAVRPAMYIDLAAQVPSSSALTQNLLPEDPRLKGLVTEALPLEDGLLLLGESEYADSGWMARVGEDGGVRWVLEEKDGGVFGSAHALPDGSFASLIVHEPNYREGTGEYSAALASVTSQGKLARTRKQSTHTRVLIALEKGWLVLGTYYPQQGDTAGAQVTVARLDLKGEKKWSTRLPTNTYAGMEFRRAALAGDSLYAVGESLVEDGNHAVFLMRLDLRGNARWTREIRLGEDTYAGGLAITPQGLVVLSATGWDHEEDGPGMRRGMVLGYSAQGDVLWEHPLIDSRSADYLLSTSQGILVGSRGLDLENCPLLGEGWLLLLDGDGHSVEAGLPNIGGGKLELMGLGMGSDGVPLLLGATISWPQAVDTAYAAHLD